MSRALATLVSLDIALLTVIGALGSHRLSGPQIVSFDNDHGMHVLDLVVIAIGLVGVIAVWWPILVSARRREPVDTARR